LQKSSNDLLNPQPESAASHRAVNVGDKFQPAVAAQRYGARWNYLPSERLQKQAYSRLFSNNYFWRTYERQELDWVEERDGKLLAHEFKRGDKQPKKPALWTDAYSGSEFKASNRSNFTEFTI